MKFYFFLLGATSIILVFFLGGLYGSISEIRDYRKMAISQGVGKYDEETGAFRLKTKKELQTFVFDEAPALPIKDIEPLYTPSLFEAEITKPDPKKKK